MKRLQFFLFFVLLFLCFSFIKGETIYIHYDENCFDRYEYLINGNVHGDVYVSYFAKLGPKHAAILDVERESKKWTKIKPDNLIPCSDLRIDKNLIWDINNGETKVFLVRSTDTHYNLTTVKKALYYQPLGQTIEVTSKDAHFLFIPDNLRAGVNMALPDSDLDAFLHGSITNQCMKGYIIRKSEGQENKNYKELTLIPDLGLVEKRAVSTTLTGREKVNVLKLDKINHTAFFQVLSEKCTEMQASLVDGQASEKTSTYGADAFFLAEEPVSRFNTFSTESERTSNLTTPATASVRQEHIVRKKETLYGIARRYGLSIDQVRSWNGLRTSNLIHPGQTLFVSAPITATTAGNTDETSTNPQPKILYSTEKYKDDVDYHRVNAGESLAKLALMYGYTEDRFRWMNGLGPNEDIYPGQLLRASDCICPNDKTTVKNRPQPYSDIPAKYDDTSRIIPGYGKKGIENESAQGLKIYVVKENDTLFSIAKTFNTTVDKLLTLNNLGKGEVLLPSQRIYVP